MNKVFIIAEAGVNHNAELDLALKMIEAAADAGADAVKFQTFKAEGVISRYAPKAEYQIKNMNGSAESQLEMARKLELKLDDFITLKEHCDQIGIKFMTTPFDHDCADFIFELIDIYKIPSGEISNLPFLEHIARKGKPIILSTGMSLLEEVELAVETVKKNQPEISSEYPPLTLLHCTSNYPTRFEDVNLRAMQTMREKFKLPIGYSDHSLGIEVPIAAAALGAEVIEKHFTLDKNMSGPDHKASLELDELKKMVESIRNVEKALGDGVKKPVTSEEEIIRVARRSLIAGKQLEKGTVLTRELIKIKRPGTGISPVDLDLALGKTLNKSKQDDEVIFWKDLD
jgi:N-acetylneuraminate synthase